MAESIEIKKSDMEDVDENDEDVEDKPRKKKSKKTDFISIGGGILSNVNYKVSFLLFVVSMLIFSDIFIDNALNKFSDAVQGECTTTKGTMLQLMFMIIAYILLDLTVKYELL